MNGWSGSNRLAVFGSVGLFMRNDRAATLRVLARFACGGVTRPAQLVALSTPPVLVSGRVGHYQILVYHIIGGMVFRDGSMPVTQPNGVQSTLLRHRSGAGGGRISAH